MNISEKARFERALDRAVADLRAVRDSTDIFAVHAAATRLKRVAASCASDARVSTLAAEIVECCDNAVHALRGLTPAGFISAEIVL